MFLRKPGPVHVFFIGAAQKQIKLCYFTPLHNAKFCMREVLTRNTLMICSNNYNLLYKTSNKGSFILWLSGAYNSLNDSISSYHNIY